MGLAVSLILLVPVYRGASKRSLEKQRQEIRQDFLSAAEILGDALRAGHSLENALLFSEKELSAFLQENRRLLQEWRQMTKDLQIGRSAEEAFDDFSRRCGVPSIRDFSEMLRISRNSGASLSEMILLVTGEMKEEARIREEIRVKLSSKYLEQRIMDVMPAAILLYVRLTSPEFLQVLYEGFRGRLIMSGCLLAYLAAFFWSERILRIRGV